MELIKRYYVIDWVRIPIKFIFSWTLLKVCYDYYNYRTQWAVRGCNPRSLSFNFQSPINPYIPTPYLHFKTYEQYMDIKRFKNLQNNLLKEMCGVIDRSFLYCDAPCRENINAIDRLLFRAKQHASSQVSQFYFLAELAKKQGQVPTGVFQQIRKNRQDQVQVQEVLVPKL